MLRIGKSSSSAASSSRKFQRLVQGLKQQGKTCTVVESCCGGLIQSSLMAVPGSSAVYYGGSVAYNTQRAKKLLLNDETLHQSLLHPPSLSMPSAASSSEGEAYIRSKEHWTAQTAVAFCDQMDVDYAISEGGASGPTFRPNDLETGFAVIAIAGKNPHTGKAELLGQSTIRSTHNDREPNMRLFADTAAEFAADTMGLPPYAEEEKRAQSQPQPQSQSQSPTERKHLDRATHLRGDKLALEEMERSDEARFLIIRDSQECLFQSDSSSTDNKLALLSRSDLSHDGIAAPSSSQESSTSFLGLDPTTQAPIFAVDVSSKDGSSKFQLLESSSDQNNITFDNIRTHAPLLQPYDYELVLYATALSNWKRTHKCCSICGQPLEPVQGGTCLQCTSSTCGNLSWPRQDPSIIVLVTNPTRDKALLARSPRHPPKVHTALAGFVEAGETFEQAVLREVQEETGAKVDYDSISYLSSQPWPFPRSCMIGFLAQVHDDTLPLTIDPSELVSASWFDKDQVHAAAQISGAVMNTQIAEQALIGNPSLDLLIPPKGVLARSLIDQWLQE